MKIKCRENIKIEIHHHPHYQSLNEKLMDDLSKLNFYSHEQCINFTNIKGSQVQLTGHPLKTKSIDLIEN